MWDASNKYLVWNDVGYTFYAFVYLSMMLLSTSFISDMYT